MINIDSFSNKMQIAHSDSHKFSQSDFVGWNGSDYELYDVNLSYEHSGIVILTDGNCYIVLIEGLFPVFHDFSNEMYYHDVVINGKVTKKKNGYPAFKVIQNMIAMGKDVRFE